MWSYKAQAALPGHLSAMDKCTCEAIARVKKLVEIAEMKELGFMGLWRAYLRGNNLKMYLELKTAVNGREH